MKNLLVSIKDGSPLFDVERVGESWVIVPKAGQEAAFNQMIEDLTFGQHEEFAILPVSDGRTGYARAVVMPFDG